jgi:predicted DNA-binding transcriptional regulator AlpA
VTVFQAHELEPGVLSLKQAGQRLGIAESTAYDLVKRGQFPVPVIKIGGRNRVLKAVLDRFLAGEDLAPAATSSSRGPATTVEDEATGAAGPLRGSGGTGRTNPGQRRAE